LSSFDKHYVEKLIASSEASLHRTYDVEVITPKHLFDRYVGDQVIDFLSIDVEGLDETILRAIDFNTIRPRLISVEFNSEEDRASMTQYLTANGYDCSKTIGCNIMAEDVHQKTKFANR
jgi:Methyltransferase FkbM domain